jgi:hypothetical protein
MGDRPFAERIAADLTVDGDAAEARPSGGSRRRSPQGWLIAAPGELDRR